MTAQVLPLRRPTRRRSLPPAGPECCDTGTACWHERATTRRVARLMRRKARR